MGRRTARPLRVMHVLAWRNLWRNYRRTFIMLLAISTAIWAMLFMIALMRGMVDQMVKDGLQVLPGHVQIHNILYPDDPSVVNSMNEPDPGLVAALSDPEISGWTTRLRVPAMVSSERENRGIILLGVDPEKEFSLGFAPTDIVAGRFLNGRSDPGVVIGQRLLERLETQLGKRVVIMSQDPENNVVDRGFRIVGVYRGKLQGFEERYVIAGRDVIQDLLKIDRQVSEIAILGKDFRDTDALEQRIREKAPVNSVVQSWKVLDSYLSTMMNVMDGFILVWIIVIFMAMSFGLVNTMMMAVFERVREIGLMLALGMRPFWIVYQVLIESLSLLGLGLLVGTLLAVATTIPLRDGIDVSMLSEGMELMGAGSVLYPELKLPDVILANTVVAVLGLLTSLLPAWRASRYRPVQAIAKV